jgi:C-terminal processing protease CtpA/Prc
LGMDFLSRYNFALDLKNRRIWTSPSTRHRSPPLFDMSGLSIIKRDSDFQVVEVKRGSPAEDAMIKAGDKVIGVEGRSKEVLSLHEIRLLLAIPNIDRNIEISQDGHPLPLVLPLRNWQNAKLQSAL